MTRAETESREVLRSFVGESAGFDAGRGLRLAVLMASAGDADEGRRNFLRLAGENRKAGGRAAARVGWDPRAW